MGSHFVSILDLYLNEKTLWNLTLTLEIDYDNNKHVVVVIRIDERLKCPSHRYTLAPLQPDVQQSTMTRIALVITETSPLLRKLSAYSRSRFSSISSTLCPTMADPSAADIEKATNRTSLPSPVSGHHEQDTATTRNPRSRPCPPRPPGVGVRVQHPPGEAPAPGASHLSPSLIPKYSGSVSPFDCVSVSSALNLNFEQTVKYASSHPGHNYAHSYG